MKFAKRLTALLIVAVMLISSCLFVNAAKATVTVNSTHTVDTGVSYSKLTVKSGQNGNSVACVALEFNPADGYMPMVFAPYAGSANVLEDYYSVATTKYGYDVAGIINGSFFDMNTSNLLGLNISNGRVSCAHSGYTGEVVAFDSNGKMDIVTSCLEYKLFIGGKEVPNSPIRYINKRYENDSWGPDRIFYYDTSCGTIADTTVKGYEVVCQKMNNSDLIVGSSLFAKVVSVGENTYGTKFESNANIESDKFVLFVKTDSSFAKYLKDLKAGDDIAIAVNETNPEAREVMEKANSAITSVGFLVKDGVDRTRIDSWIGAKEHPVTLDRGWTAFGQKADGSYVFFTSTDGSAGSGKCITMRDIADYMISKGCVNVIRMDGGGSSAMYLKKTSAGSAGYAQYSSRKVTDGIMVVKKSSAVKSELVTALNTAIANAKASVASTPNASLSAAIAEAEAAVKKGNVVSGDARALIAKLSGKKELFTIATTASSASYLDYSEESLIALREKYAEALKLYFSGTATASQIQATTQALTDAYNNSLATVISVGKSYTTTAPNRGGTDQNNDDGSRLTNGAKCGAGAGTNAYSGWSSGVNPEITVDLGSSMSSDTYTVYAASMASWGIPAPGSVNVKVSSNGSTWTDIGTCKDITYRQSDSTTGTGKTNYYSFTVKANSVQNARYVKFTVDGGNHTWIDEVEVALSNKNAGKSIENAIYINGVNRSINAGDSHVFTPAFGTVTPDKANTNYSATIVLTSTSVENQYTVKSITFNNGNAADYNLASDEILLVCHSDSAVPNSLLNLAILQTVKSGDKLNVFGVDTAESSLGIAAYARPVSDSEGGSESTSSNVALGKDYTTSTLYPEGGSASYPDETGKTMTDGVNASFNGTYSDPAFIGFNKGTSDYAANGYASITVDLGKKYDLDKFVAKVASSLNKVSGITAPATVSVFVSNDNKTWTEAGSVNPIDNPTFSTVDATVTLDKAVCARYVQYRFVGSSNWIMVAEVEAYGVECDDAEVILGDVDASGKVDSYDYLLVKRACFDTYDLSDVEFTRAEVSGDSKIDSADYLLIKRIAFGTYTA